MVSGVVAVATCIALAVSISSTSEPSPTPDALESIFDLTSSLRKRPRTDIDPGSLRGLVQAAESTQSGKSRWGNDARGASRRRLWGRHGMKHVNGPALSLQQRETTQRRIERNLRAAHTLKRSLGSTIAQYFTTVRSVKDDQGTFLG